MNKPSFSPTPLRRALLAGAPLLAVAAVAAPRMEASLPRSELLSVNPDAELIRICRAHGLNREAFNNDPTAGDEDHPLWLEYRRTLEYINTAKPQTTAGMIAKANAAIGESFNHGEESPENTHAAEWAWNLVHDIIRLGGSVPTTYA